MKQVKNFWGIIISGSGLILFGLIVLSLTLTIDKPKFIKEDLVISQIAHTERGIEFSIQEKSKPFVIPTVTQRLLNEKLLTGYFDKWIPVTISFVNEEEYNYNTVYGITKDADIILNAKKVENYYSSNNETGIIFGVVLIFIGIGYILFIVYKNKKHVVTFRTQNPVGARRSH